MLSIDEEMPDRGPGASGILDDMEALIEASDVAQGLLSLRTGTFGRCGETLDLQVEPHVDDGPVLFGASLADVSDDLACT